MAYVNGDERHWWEHPADAGYGGRYYWPPNTADTLEGWTSIFIAQGYEITDNYEIEVGFEKVAIYVDSVDLSPTHVAKSDGRMWKSKLGGDYDIEHNSLELLEGDQEHEYGIVGQVLKKAIKQ